jgi:hypothetical protein
MIKKIEVVDGRIQTIGEKLDVLKDKINEIIDYITKLESIRKIEKW